MTNPLRSRLGYDRNALIDEDEVKIITKTIDTAAADLADVAEAHDTADTSAIVQVAGLLLRNTLKTLDPATARKLLAAYNGGEVLQAGVDPELARKAELYDKVTDASIEGSLAAQLKKLQEAQTDTGPRGLGAGSASDPAVETVMERIRPLVTNVTAARVDNLIDLITTAQGLNPQVAGERSELALLIMEGGNHARLGNWAIVDDPNGTHRKPQILVDLYSKVKALATERDDAKSALAEERNDKKSGSLASKLKDAEAAKVTAETAKTTAETALATEKDDKKSGSLAKLLKDAKDKLAAAPTDTVDKAAVKTEVDKVAAELSKVKLGLNGVKNVDETKAALRKVNDLVKP